MAATIHLHHTAQLAYTLADIIVKHPQEACCVVVSHSKEANALHDTLTCFAPNEQHRIVILPDWETLAYESIPVDTSLISQRLLALNHMLNHQNPVVICTQQSFQTLLPPTSFIKTHALRIKLDDTINKLQLQADLLANGYTLRAQIETAGQIASRGAILDFFPMGSSNAYRIEWFDQHIDGIRQIDIDTQLSKKRVESLSFFPTHEFSFTSTQASWRMQRAKTLIPNADDSCYPLPYLRDGYLFSGIEYYLPLLHETLASLWDYLPSSCNYYLADDWMKSTDLIYKNWKQRYNDYQSKQAIIAPEHLLCTPERMRKQLAASNHALYCIAPQTTNITYHLDPCPPLHLNQRNEQGILSIKKMLKQGMTLCFVVSEAHKQNNLVQHLASHRFHAELTPCFSIQTLNTCKGGMHIAVGYLEQGFIDQQKKIVYISEFDLFGRSIEPARTKKNNDRAHHPLENHHEWSLNTLLVHRDYGIGSFAGIVTKSHMKTQKDYIQLTYYNQDKLFVPIDQIRLLSKYKGPKGDNAPLDTLGTGSWEKKRKKALAAIEDLSAKLLQQHALRQRQKAYTIAFCQNDYLKLCEDFPYETTADQQRAIDETLKDLQQSKAMDRLICGDVGFGKTEVALRATFVSILAGYQVALLAPTTLLASQHFETFQQRFANWPIRIALLSRMTGAKSEDSIQGIKQGSIDMVIGTHKLLMSNLHFHKLALLIVDEEHKFGVKHKEMIHHLKGQSHILSLSATPIPRTLNMAMSKLRDLSIIASPPASRQNILTSVHMYQDHVIKDAIYRELQRGGQVYYLHNDIQLHARIKDHLQAWFPSCIIGTVHGQMPKGTLETTMQAFYQNNIHILICTTIVESGIDVANANTILINRADLLGLSQLHQLRGRVGRSNRLSYAYFLTPATESMGREAKLRLDSIAKHQNLGSGLSIAMEDLELRGAGDLLGASQSGHAQFIGMELYSQFLKKASQSDQPYRLEDDTPVEIKSSISAIIPEAFVPNPVERVQYYRNIDQASNQQSIEDIQKNLENRYGFIPNTTMDLLHEASVKIAMRNANVPAITISKTFLQVQLPSNAFSNIPLERIQAFCAQNRIGFARNQYALLLALPSPYEKDVKTHSHVLCQLLQTISPQKTT